MPRQRRRALLALSLLLAARPGLPAQELKHRATLRFDRDLSDKQPQVAPDEVVRRPERRRASPCGGGRRGGDWREASGRQGAHPTRTPSRYRAQRAPELPASVPVSPRRANNTASRCG